MRPIRWSFSFALLGLLACQARGETEPGHAHEGEHEAEGEHGHGHGHGAEVAIGITRWTEELELYAEHPPAVVGREVEFLAHLTVLDGFRALESGEVTLELEGPGRLEARVTEALRPGIFQPVFAPRKPGTYRAKLVVRAPPLDEIIDGFEVEVYPSEEAAARAHPGGEDESPRITFLKEQQWQVPFDTAFAREGSVAPTVGVSGEVTTPPSGRAELGAGTAGRVVPPPGGLPRPGQEVRRGQLLATIAPAPASPEAGAQAGLAVAEAEARLEAARAAVARSERLLATRAISERKVDEARRELAVSEQAVSAARRASGIFAAAASGRGAGAYRITSPLEGIVSEVRATTGATVAPGDLLFRVVDVTELWIRARVPEREAIGIRADQDASLSLPGLEAPIALDVTGEDANASVVSVARTIDPESRTVDVIYALSRPDERLRVGALVEVHVPVGEPESGVVVPASAVIDDDGRALVYVQVEGEAFDERQVGVGASTGARVIVASGLRPGERVVTKGANLVRLSARAGSAPAHGHVH